MYFAILDTDSVINNHHFVTYIIFSFAVNQVAWVVADVDLNNSYIYLIILSI